MVYTVDRRMFFRNFIFSFVMQRRQHVFQVWLVAGNCGIRLQKIGSWPWTLVLRNLSIRYSTLFPPVPSKDQNYVIRVSGARDISPGICASRLTPRKFKSITSACPTLVARRSGEAPPSCSGADKRVSVDYLLLMAGWCHRENLAVSLARGEASGWQRRGRVGKE